jgi:hypothetical protein
VETPAKIIALRIESLTPFGKIKKNKRLTDRKKTDKIIFSKIILFYFLG